MYKLKPEIEYSKMFQIISKCKKNVYFETAAGDKINLKSIFSRFVFITLMANKTSFKNGHLICDEEDVPFLSDYIEGSNEMDT